MFRRIVPLAVLTASLAASAEAQFCTKALRDKYIASQCIEASTIPNYGLLLPLGPEFFVDPTGNVGISNLTPAARLDVNGTSIFRDTMVIEDTMNARIQAGIPGGARILGEQGLTPTRPAIGFFSTNGVDDGGGGNGIYRPTANVMAFATLSTERMRITSGGRVGINTQNPGCLLDVNGDACKPGGGSWSVASDERLKKNVAALEGALETLLALHGVTFEYKDPAATNQLEGTQIGFVAQQVEEVLPGWVDERADGMKMVTVRGFEALCVEALRELSDENDALRAENEELRERVEQLEALEARLAALEQRAR